MNPSTSQLRTRRCRIGMCSNLALPAVWQCAACRRVRIAVERQRRATDLAKETAAKLASDVPDEAVVGTN